MVNQNLRNNFTVNKKILVQIIIIFLLRIIKKNYKTILSFLVLEPITRH